MFAYEKALIELTKAHSQGHLLLIYQLSAAVLQVILAAGEQREGGYSKSNTTSRGSDTQWAPDGTQDPGHSAHHLPGEAWHAHGFITPTKKTASLPLVNCPKTCM